MNNNNLAGSVAVVTGCGRKQGIGRATALALAAAGADVAVTDIAAAGTRNAGEVGDADAAAGWKGLPSLVEELEGRGSRALPVLGDVGIKDDAERMVREVVEHYGRIDILVNNAAAPHGGDRTWLWEVSEETFDEALRVNTKGVFLMSTAVIRHLLQRGGPGRIINIASVAGTVGLAQRGPYCTSKFAVRGLTQTMAQELAPHGITVNAVCPGAVDTSRRASSATHMAALQESGVQTLTFNQVAGPEAVAHAVAFLAHPESGYINGQSIIVNGGSAML